MTIELMKPFTFEGNKTLYRVTRIDNYLETIDFEFMPEYDKSQWRKGINMNSRIKISRLIFESN
jgi:hypothetical protein